MANPNISSGGMNYSLTRANQTAVLTFHWYTQTIFVTCTSVIGPCANFVPFVAILTKRLWKNPFYIYILNLLSVNILQHITFDTSEAVASGYNRWIFSNAFCTFRMYMNYVIGVGHFYSHLLITINRIWAAAKPISYKNHHSVKVALTMCGAMWVSVHAIQLPGVIMDAMIYRPPTYHKCILDVITLWLWEAFSVVGLTTVWITNIAACVVIVSKREKKKVGGTGTSTWAGASGATSANGTEQEFKEVLHQKRNNQAFRIFVVMTTSISLTWAPLVVFFALGPLLPYNPYVLAVTFFIYQMQGTIVDPVLFVLAMKDLKQAVFFCKAQR